MTQNDLFALHISIGVQHIRLALHNWHAAHACDLWRSSEHLVITLLSIDELKLVEFHVILLFLYEVVFARDLFGLVLDHFQVFRTRWPRFVELL